MERIGALWLKNGKNGKFMSGTIEVGEDEESSTALRILVFKNTFKEKEQHPDYVIYLPTGEDTKPNRDSDEGPL